MHTYNTRKAFTLGVVAALTIALAGWWFVSYAGSARPVSGAQASASSVQSIQAFGSGRPHVIPAAAFVADGANPDSYFFPFSGGYIQGDADAYGCVEAPVYLPNNAKIDAVLASVYDNDDTNEISMNISRVDNFNGDTNVLASLSTSGTATDIQVIDDTTINYPDVSFPDYSYYATVCVDSSSVRLYSIRIYYYDAFIYLPLVLSNA